jgi:hypothetical protein
MVGSRSLHPAKEEQEGKKYYRIINLESPSWRRGKILRHTKRASTSRRMGWRCPNSSMGERSSHATSTTSVLPSQIYTFTNSGDGARHDVHDTICTFQPQQSGLQSRCTREGTCKNVEAIQTNANQFEEGCWGIQEKHVTLNTLSLTKFVK